MHTRMRRDTKTRDRNMGERRWRWVERQGGGKWRREREERGIKPLRCWLERGPAVSASGTCCYSEGWGVKLVSAEALRGVRWLWEKRDRRQRHLDGETWEERKMGTGRVNVAIKLAAGIMGRVGRNNRFRQIKWEWVWQILASRVIV